MRKIILVGYMAVGKTTVAQLLAEKMKIKAVDIDQLIEKKTGYSIAQLFEQKGEIYFRKLEHELFKELVAADESLVISTGGGTPCYADNHLLMNGDGITSVYLKAALDTIIQRMASEKDERPLVADKSGEELTEFIAKHLFERSYFYNQAAHILKVDGLSPEAIADEIVSLLK